MTKTTTFNDLKPQWQRDDHKMQPIILSNADKPACWDCCWKDLVDCCGLMPYVTGVPSGSVSLSTEEKNAILRRWAGYWKVAPVPPMSLKGHNAKFYIQYTDAYLNGDTMTLWGGTHEGVRSTTGTLKSTGRPLEPQSKAKVSLATEASIANEGQVNKLVLFRAPDGTLYLDNIGTFLVREEAGELEMQTAMGWKICFFRDPAAQAVAQASVAASKMMDRGEDVPGKIAKLKELHDSGAITMDEFNEGKAKLLSRM